MGEPRMPIVSENSKEVSGNEKNEAEQKIEQLQREVDTLKRSMVVLMGSMHGFTRMLFNSGGRGLDEYPKRDVIFDLEETMRWVSEQIASPTTDAESKERGKESK